MTLEDLQSEWKEVYAQTLPEAAKSRALSQPVWPVSLDHCFARIILDNAVGITVPWPAKIKSPAYKHMTEEQIKNAISMARAILSGEADLRALNDKSLALRGKEHHRNRVPLITTTDPTTEEVKKEEGKSYASLIDGAKEMSEFRRTVLHALLLVPRGRWTSYRCISDYLKSSPRAVGSAMRRNPFAPMVPCHRVLAHDGSIGGFGGDWGSSGAHAREKVKLLRAEGVKFDGRGKVVGRPFTFAENCG